MSSSDIYVIIPPSSLLFHPFVFSYISKKEYLRCNIDVIQQKNIQKKGDVYLDKAGNEIYFYTDGNEKLCFGPRALYQLTKLQNEIEELKELKDYKILSLVK